MAIDKKKINIALFALLALPCAAFANAGTPLIWGTMFHMAIGNILIGVVEGRLLRCKIHDKGYQAVALMILANFFSAICGFAMIFAMDVIWTSHWTLYNFKAFFFFTVMILWFATVILEWPFVWLAMGKTLRRWGNAFKCSLLLQSASYILLIAWYMLCGSHSLLTCKVVEPEEIGIPDNVCIYYISDINEGIFKARPNIRSHEKIKHVIPQSDPTRIRALLVFIENVEDPTKADLAMRGDWNSQLKNYDYTVIQPRIADVENVPLTKTNDEKIVFSTAGEGKPLGKAKESNYRFLRNWHSEFGLELYKRRENIPPQKKHYTAENADSIRGGNWQRVRRLFAYGSPIASQSFMLMFNIIQFENDTILLEFRNHQVCLFDYRTGRIALLARGYGATAAIE